MKAPRSAREPARTPPPESFGGPTDDSADDGAELDAIDAADQAEADRASDDRRLADELLEAVRMEFTPPKPLDPAAFEWAVQVGPSENPDAFVVRDVIQVFVRVAPREVVKARPLGEWPPFETYAIGDQTLVYGLYLDTYRAELLASDDPNRVRFAMAGMIASGFAEHMVQTWRPALD